MIFEYRFHNIITDKFGQQMFGGPAGKSRSAAVAVFVLVWKMEIEALPYSYAVGWVVMLLYELPMLVRYLRSHGDEL